MATTHRMTGTPEHRAWGDMKTRCFNANVKNYERYGGRAVPITIDPRWLGKHGFENFYTDMGPRPPGKMSLDRKNNDGPYTKSNCRWATYEVQENNRSNNVILTFRGRSLTIALWAKELGISRRALWGRIALAGWSVERSLTTPKRKWNKKVTP